MQPHFLTWPSRAGGERFAILHAPQGVPRGAVLAVQPLAEEMNRCRRMVNLAARGLANAGFAVLLLDLYGCGDSSGELEDARWADWVDDIIEAARWLQLQHAAPLWLWGTRAGSLLACEAARRMDRPPGFVFWQPQSSGKLALQQFLRLKVAGQLRQGGVKGATASLLAELASDAAVEVGGYRLRSGLTDGFGAATLAPVSGARQLVWLEVSAREPTQLLPASMPVLQAWLASGCAVHHEAVAGPPFWQTVWIEDAPELITATARLMTAATDQPAR